MQSPGRLRKEARAEAERLRDALRELVERERVELKELAARTARSDGYWSQVFSGRVNLGAEHIFAVLAAVEIEPGPFFAKLYPPVLAMPTNGGRERIPPEEISETMAVLATAMRRLSERMDGLEEREKRGETG